MPTGDTRVQKLSDLDNHTEFYEEAAWGWLRGLAREAKKGNLPDLDYSSMPKSVNIEDRRNPPTGFNKKVDFIFTAIKDFAKIPEQVLDELKMYFNQSLGPYDKDIEKSIKRFKLDQEKEYLLRTIMDRLSWYREIAVQEQGTNGPKIPERLKKEYENLDKKYGNFQDIFTLIR